MIDVHCHLEYMEDPQKVIDEARQKMRAVITSVPNPKETQSMIDLVERNRNFLFLCAGFHPEHLHEYTREQVEDHMEFIKKNRKNIAAIGEVGVDYNWLKKEEERRKSEEVFAQFIDLAKETHKPLVIHTRSDNPKTRDAVDDALKILTNSNAKDVIMHCFSGSEENLKYALEQNYWISYATIIVRSDKHKRLAGNTPIESMLLETDAPWLDPDSKDLVNRPWKIERSAEVIAGIKDTTKEDVLKQTEENAISSFRLMI